MAKTTYLNGMKIALVCKHLSFITGGPRLLLGLAQNLKQMGEEVVIYAGDAQGDYFKELMRDIPIHIIPPAFSWNGPAPAGLLQWISYKAKEEASDIAWAKTVAAAMDPDVDIVNVHDLPYRVGFFYKKRNPKAKVVWQENIPLFLYVKRGKALHDLVGRLYWFVKRIMDRKYFKAIDAAAVLDELTKKRRQERGFKNVTIVRAGIDFEKFYAPVKDFREKAAGKKVQLFALGALNAIRRFDNVIEAIRYLRQWGYDARAKVVAKNVWHEDACRDGLVALVAQHRLEPYVELNFEGLPEDELAKTFQASDVFVQAVYAPPPMHQGWGLVNFEAMAAGLALVVIRSSSATEVLQDGKTALFFEPLKSEEIANRVKFLVDHPDEYDRIAKAGQAYVKENQSWKKYAGEMLALFRKTAKRI
jgi:glycosyltransferase involved in cell wall biosynthesis